MNSKTLTSCLCFKICLFVYSLQLADAANVTVDVFGRLDDNNTLACNTNVTFVCSVKPATDTMIWSIDKTTVAGCSFGMCYNGSSKPSNNLFEHDTSNGIYNLTFRPVLDTDNGKVYKCKFGPDSELVSPSVKVFPDETSSIITNSTTSNGIVITASTCMSSGSLTFKWFIFKEDEDRKNFSIKPNNSFDISSCSSTTNCQGRRSISTLNIKDHTDEGGEAFFFQVEIIYTFSSDVDPYILKVNSSHSFKLQDVKTDQDKECFAYIIIIIELVVRFHFIQTLISGYNLYKALPKDGPKYLKREYKLMGCLASIPIVGLIVQIQTTGSDRIDAGNPAVTFGCNEKCMLILCITVLDPAAGICVCSILYANKVEIAASWTFILFNALGCMTVIGMEVIMLIPCIELCLDVVYHVPLVILYFVLLWIYLTLVVLYLKLKIGISSCYQVTPADIVLIVWWHFPLCGTIIELLHWFCKLDRDKHKVTPEPKRSKVDR